MELLAAATANLLQRAATIVAGGNSIAAVVAAVKLVSVAANQRPKFQVYVQV